MMKKMLLAGTILNCTALAILANRDASAAERVKEFACQNVANNATIEIDNVAGSVTVIGSDTDTVKVTARLSKDVVDVKVECDEDRVSIEVILPEGVRRQEEGEKEADEGRPGAGFDAEAAKGKEIEAQLEISVPKGCSLGVQTVSAGVEVEKVSGAHKIETVAGGVAIAGESRKLEIKTLSGGIDITGNSGSMEAHSVSGDIAVTGDADRIAAESVNGKIGLSGSAKSIKSGTVNGTIVLEGKADNVEAETVNGGITVNGAVATLRAETVNGSVKVGTVSASAAIKTLNGAVKIGLDEAWDGTVKCTTFSGGIQDGFGHTSVSTGGGPGEGLAYTLGEGTHSVRIETFHGAIHILKKSGL